MDGHNWKNSFHHKDSQNSTIFDKDNKIERKKGDCSNKKIAYITLKENSNIHSFFYEK